MKNSASRWFGGSLLVVAAALSSACSDGAPVAPAVVDGGGNQLPDLTGCEQLAAPVGSTLVLRAFAIGVQIYHWDGASWGSAVPSANLYADAGGQVQVGTHFAGPTWQSNTGGTVVGTVADRCTPDAASLPWLALTAVPNGPGVFEKVKFVQRLKTVGGNAPSTPGSLVGEEARVPYTADYLFYETP